MSTDELILSLVLTDKLKVDEDTLHVYYFHSKRRRWYRKIEKYHPKSGRRMYNYGPRRQTVYKNRLVFIHKHRRVPQGVVDHKDFDRLNDHPDNLQEMSRKESNRQGGLMSQGKMSADDFFDHIAIFGFEPEESHAC